MLQKLADHVAACHARAVHYESRAGQIQDEAIRADYLEMARRWNHLTETYEFVGSLERSSMPIRMVGPLTLRKSLSRPSIPKAARDRNARATKSQKGGLREVAGNKIGAAD
jgi:hypothetical protein